MLALTAVSVSNMNSVKSFVGRLKRASRICENTRSACGFPRSSNASVSIEKGDETNKNEDKIDLGTIAS